MKKLLTAFLLLATVVAKSQTQDLIPGYEFSEPGTIYITETDSLKGWLVFSYIKNNQVTLIPPPNSGKNKEYKPGDILGFRLHDSRLNFLPGKMGLGQAAFLQVMTPGLSKSKVVKTFSIDKTEKVEAGKTPKGMWWISLYLPTQKANFEATKKVAEAIKTECPALSEKIAKKEKGYFVNLMSTEEETLDAFTRIANELEAGCK
jgi:hypothetical protein